MKKRRKDLPLMLLWSKRDQRRFIDAVEQLVGQVHDLQTLLDPVKRKAWATPGLWPLARLGVTLGVSLDHLVLGGRVKGGA